VRAFELAHAAHLLVRFQFRQDYPAAQAQWPTVAPARGKFLASHARLRWQFAFHGLLPIYFSYQKSTIFALIRAQPSYIHG
jgi:hypothetical protein